MSVGRTVTAMAIDVRPSGEGQWEVLLPSSPPRTVHVMVGPFGSMPGEKWLSLGYDQPTQTHLGGPGADAAGALYAVVEAYQDLMAGRWPAVARTADPRDKPEPATIVPLATLPPPVHRSQVEQPPAPQTYGATPSPPVFEAPGPAPGPAPSASPGPSLPPVSSKKATGARKRRATAAR